MGKYLQNVEARYKVGRFFNADDAMVSAGINEVATLYCYNLPRAKIITFGVTKIILIGGATAENITALSDIIMYEHSYRFISKLQPESTLKEIKISFVQEITESLLRIGNFRKWDADPILSFEKFIEKAGYKFEDTWLKPKPNMDKTVSVGVGWITRDKIEIGFIVKKGKNSEEIWLPIVKTKIGLGLIEDILGKFSWENNQIARLWNSNKRDYWELDTNTMRIHFHYGPAEDGNPHGQYALAKMYLDGGYLVEQDTSKALEWLKKSTSQGFAKAKKLLETLG